MVDLGVAVCECSRLVELEVEGSDCNCQGFFGKLFFDICTITGSEISELGDFEWSGWRFTSPRSPS